MAKYRKKPVVVEATQWFKSGDHPVVIHPVPADSHPIPFAALHGDECGLINTLEGEMVVSPGDWIITGIKGEYYPCKVEIFELTYDLVEDNGSR